MDWFLGRWIMDWRAGGGHWTGGDWRGLGCRAVDCRGTAGNRLAGNGQWNGGGRRPTASTVTVAATLPRLQRRSDDDDIQRRSNNNGDNVPTMMAIFHITLLSPPPLDSGGLHQRLWSATGCGLARTGGDSREIDRRLCACRNWTDGKCTCG
jgi:hypothetical protein